MQAFRECFVIAMSPYERDDLAANLGLVWEHLEGYFKQAGDVEAGTEDAKLMDAMAVIADLYRRIENGKFA